MSDQTSHPTPPQPNTIDEAHEALWIGQAAIRRSLDALRAEQRLGDELLATELRGFGAALGKLVTMEEVKRDGRAADRAAELERAAGRRKTLRVMLLGLPPIITALGGLAGLAGVLLSSADTAEAPTLEQVEPADTGATP